MTNNSSANDLLSFELETGSGKNGPNCCIGDSGDNGVFSSGFSLYLKTVVLRQTVVPLYWGSHTLLIRLLDFILVALSSLFLVKLFSK